MHIFELICDSCLGAGEIKTPGGLRPCLKCDGIGLIPTETGRQLMAFLSHRLPRIIGNLDTQFSDDPD